MPKIVRKEDGTYQINATFTELTDLLMSLELDIFSDQNADVHYNRKKFIDGIKKAVYEIPARTTEEK